MFGWFSPKKKEVVAPLPPVRIEHDFDRGHRVVVKQTAGFHKGAKGTVAFVEPRGCKTDLIWVDRDGSGKAVWYMPDELERIDQVNADQHRPLTSAQPTRPSI